MKISSPSRFYIIYYFVLYSAVGFFTPLFPVYLRETLNLNNTQVGMILSISPIIAVFVPPLWGILTDITRKPRLILSIVTLASMVLGFLFIFEKNYGLTLFHFAVLAFFSSNLGPLSDAIAIGFVTGEKRNNFGTIRAFGSIGYACAALVGGYIANWFGLLSNFALYSLLLLCSLLFLRRLKSYTTHKKISLRKDIGKLFTVGKYWVIILLMVLILGSTFGIGSYLGLYIIEKGGSIQSIGLITFLMAGLEMPFMIYSRKITKRFNMSWIILFCAGLSTLRIFLLSMNLSLVIFVIVAVSQCMIIGLLVPVILEYIQTVIPSVLLTTGITVYTSIVFGFGRWLFTLIAGSIADASSYAKMYQFFSLISLFGFLCCIFVFRPRLKRVQ